MKALPSGILVIAIGVLTFAAEAPQAAERAFAHFVGNWSGSGTISVKDGGRERIRCRGNHTESGDTLKLGLKCASDSYKFELQSDITYENGAVSGSWNEATRGVYGTLSGRMTSSHIEATAQSSAFNASLSISTRGNRQSVVIKSPGSEISEVAISLARSGR
jgi:hypothetical protein